MAFRDPLSRKKLAIFAVALVAFLAGILAVLLMPGSHTSDHSSLGGSVAALGGSMAALSAAFSARRSRARRECQGGRDD